MKANVFRNVNCFLPVYAFVFVALNATLGTLIHWGAAFTAIFFEKGLPYPEFNYAIYLFLLLMELIVLGIYWKRSFFYVAEAKYGKEKRLNRGNWILMFANAALVLSFLVPVFDAYALGNKEAGLLYLGLAVVIPVVAFLWLFGLIMVYSSKQ